MYSESTKNAGSLFITGESRQDCINKLVKMYGNGYQVLSVSHKLKSSLFGIIQKDFFEMEYVVNPKSASSVTQQPGMSMGTNYGMQPQGAGKFYQPGLSGFPPVNGSAGIDQNLIAVRDKILGNASSNVTNTMQIAQIAKQMEELKSTLAEQMKTVIQATSAEGEHNSISKIRDLLEENGFSKSYRNNICKRMKSEFSMDELNDYEYVQQKVVEWVAESIPIAEAEPDNPPKVIILVGPTGVGKTTTIAKMGASIAVDFKKNKEKYKFPPRIRMITTDTMRVAACEQLKRWAEIINVDVDKAETSEDFKGLYESYASNSDFIFVDTSGYSPNDYENIAKMHTILDVKTMHESVYLVVTAGVSVEDFENIIRNFESFNFKSVIITKCDESKYIGRVVSVLSERKKPVSWITTGQEVMKTIQRADPMWFVGKLSGFKFDEKDVEKRLEIADKKEGALSF